MRQHLQAMFAVLTKVEKPDPKVTLAIRKIAEKIFQSQLESPSKNLNDFSTATKREAHLFEITPVNIALITEIFRFAARSHSEMDENVAYVLQGALEKVFPGDWRTQQQVAGSQNAPRHPFTVNGFQNNEQMLSVLLMDICQSITECFKSQAIHKTVVEIIQHHLNLKGGFLAAIFMESDQELEPYLNLAPLLQFLSQKRIIAHKNIHLPPEKWHQSVKILRYVLRPEFVTPQDALTLQSLCIKDLFAKHQGVTGSSPTSLESLALLVKLSFIQKQSYHSEVIINKILVIYMRVMVDRVQPQITLQKLALVLNTILQSLNEELQSGTCDKEAHSILGELIEWVSLFCQNAGIQDMNKQLLPLLNQQTQLTNYVISEQTTDISSNNPPLMSLFLHMKDTVLFEDFLAALFKSEFDYLHKRNNTFESSFASKFLQRLTQYTHEHQKPQSFIFKIKLQQIWKRKSSSQLLSSFVASLRNEEKGHVSYSLKIVFGQLLSFKEDFGHVFEDFTKTFKRKRYSWLFVDTSVIVFSQLKDLSTRVRFLSKVVQVLQFHVQQQFQIQDIEWLNLLQSVAFALDSSGQLKLSDTQSEDYRQSMTKLWFLAALSNLTNQSNFQSVLVDLARVTPVITYDPEFQLQIRSAAKNQELDQFAESVFDTLQNQVLNSRGVTLDRIVRRTTKRLKNEVINVQDQKILDISFSEREEENIEVGLELTLPERVFLACFAQINRFKILSKREHTYIGASFIQQLVSTFATENNFNVVQGENNRSITSQEMQKINTPFGKQLDFLSKALVTVHLDQEATTGWTQDFSFLLKQMCADSWTTRYIARYLCQLYLMREPSVSTKILQTYCQLLNILQLNISRVYNSLSQPQIIGDSVLVLPEDVTLLKTITQELTNLLSQQYIAASILGNRSQMDFNIKQIVSDFSVSSQNLGNLGPRILQSLSSMDINAERLNILDLSQKFSKENKQFVSQIQTIHNRIQQHTSTAGVFNFFVEQRQPNLTLVQPYEQIQNSLLQIHSVESNSLVKVQSSQIDVNFHQMAINASEVAKLLHLYENIETLQAKGVKKAILIETLKAKFQSYQMVNLPIFQVCDENLDFKSNSFFQNPNICKQQAGQRLREILQVLFHLASEPIQVIVVIQILQHQPVFLLNYLMFLGSEKLQLLQSATKALNSNIAREIIFPPKKWQKQVGRLKNSVHKDIRQKNVDASDFFANQKQMQLPEQFRNTGVLHIDIIVYLRNMGLKVDKLLDDTYMLAEDLYSNLMYVKLVLETNSDVEVIQRLALKLLGRQFKSSSIGEVNIWVQLLVDIRSLLKKEEVVLSFLLSHFKWQIISWNFQFQITQQVADFAPPLLSGSAAKKFVKRWPKLALKIADKKINNKFIESYQEALTDYVHQNPINCLRESQTLEIYLKSKNRKSSLANIWRTDNAIQLIRSLSLKSKQDLLTCQLAIKALYNASPKKVIFFLPQLFQSIRIDSKMNNIIGDFLIRKSQESVSVAHNVLWFCKVESVLPDERETHARKVPLPLQKENINQLTNDLFKIISSKLGNEERKFFETETNFFEKITSISGLLQPAQSKDQKKAIIKEKLIEYSQEIPECVYLPTNQNCRVVGIVTTSGMPMQSAARVPILISFEVEEYPGPDKDQLMVHDSFVQSVGKISKEVFQSKKIQNTLLKFQKTWVPQTSEEDIDDDISFDQAAHEISIHEGIGSNDATLIRGNTTIQQLTRQLIPNKTMFSNGIKQVINKTKVESKKTEEKVKVKNEEDQRLFFKLIKQHTFKNLSDKPTTRISTVVSQIININQKAPSFKDMLQYQLGVATPLKLARSKSIKHRLNSDAERPEVQTNTAQHVGPIKVISCIFKVNDDLRQDILALQFIKHFQRIFKQNDLDLFVAPYRCISNRTGVDKLLGGIIEVVPNSHSRDQLGKAFEINLHEYFLKKYGSESTAEFKAARYNFIRSLAAYAVVSFILQIKDRHNGNILIDESGHLIHIDFGFIFDWSPGKDMKFESAAFKLTQEFIDILGGSSDAPAFRLFENMVIQGYLAVREHSDDFLSLTELMFYSGFPCFKPFSLQNLETRFRKDLSQAEAARLMRDLVQDAANKWTTRVYDFVQYKQNKIVF